jgi:hypothetical protein
METQVKTQLSMEEIVPKYESGYGISYVYSKNEIVKIINKTLDKIKNIIKQNDYQVAGNIDKYYNIDWKHLSGNQMKKIQKYCVWIIKKPSLKKLNAFFSLLSIYFSIDRVRIKISLKEEKIQKARKEWLKVRNEADRLLKIYKEEKGDFYKIKLIFNK